MHGIIVHQNTLDKEYAYVLRTKCDKTYKRDFSIGDRIVDVQILTADVLQPTSNVFYLDCFSTCPLGKKSALVYVKV